VDHVRALVATHVHIDHVGRIPWLLAAGFKGPIYCSEPSARLLPVVLADAFAMGVTRDARLVERYLRMVEARIRPLAYDAWQPVFAGPGGACRIRLQRAGHILGSAYVECDITARGRDAAGGVLGRPGRTLDADAAGAALARGGRRGGAGEHLRRQPPRKPPHPPRAPAGGGRAGAG
jgi:hypothetical protein